MGLLDPPVTLISKEDPPVGKSQINLYFSKIMAGAGRSWGTLRVGRVGREQGGEHQVAWEEGK